MKKHGYLLSCVIMFTFISTLAFSRDVNSDSIKKLYSMSLKELMNVQITTAGKTEQKLSDIPASVEIITRKDIEIYGYTSLREIINQINGMYILSNLGVDIYAERGFTKGKGNNFIIMVNDVKITDNKILKFYELPIEMIDKIEVVRGPMAVVYGNNAFFGVINILTNEIVGKDVHNFSTISYGSSNTTKLFTRVSSQSDKIKIVLNLALHSSDGDNFSLSKMISKPERMDEELFGGEEGMGLNLPEYARKTENFLANSYKFLNIFAKLNKLSFNLYYIESKNGWYYYYPSLADGCTFKNRNTTFSLSYSDDLSNDINFDIKIRYSNTNIFNNYRHLFEGFYGWDRAYFNELEGEINLFWHPKKTINIVLGMQYENMMQYVDDTNVPVANIINTTTYFIDDDDDGIIYSAFVQADYNPLPRLKLVAGLRVEKMMGYGFKIVENQGYLSDTNEWNSEISDYKKAGDIYLIPRLAAIYQINNSNIIKVLYGKAIKRPDYVTVGEDLIDIAAGQKLGGYSKPEFIYTREINLFSTISKDFAFSLSVFWNTLYNLIVENNVIVNNILKAWFDNSGKMETKGVEGSVLLTFNSQMKFEIGGTYQNTIDKQHNIDASYSPNFIGYFKFGYQLRNKLILSLTGNYRSSMKPFYSNYPRLTEDCESTGTDIGWSSRQVPENFIISVNCKVNNFPFKNTFINIHCSNLFNTQIYYPTFAINNAWADMGTLGAKRKFIITVGHKF